MTRFLLTLLAAAALAAAQPATPRTMRLDYVHSGTATEENFALDGVVARRRVAGTARPLDRRHQPRQVLLPGDRPRHQPPALFARLRQRLTASGRPPTKPSCERRAFHESVALPGARRRPCRWCSRSAARATSSARSGRRWWIRPTRAIDRAAPPKLNVWAVMQNGAAARQGGPAAPGRRLHRRGDGEVARRRPAPGRRCCSRPRRSRSIASDFNVWAIDTPADESGVSRPSDGVYRALAAAAPATTPSARSATC